MNLLATNDFFDELARWLVACLADAEPHCATTRECGAAMAVYRDQGHLAKARAFMAEVDELLLRDGGLTIGDAVARVHPTCRKDKRERLNGVRQYERHRAEIKKLLRRYARYQHRRPDQSMRRINDATSTRAGMRASSSITGSSFFLF